jgi:peptidyl-prolyl cis-trans isomerase C
VGANSSEDPAEKARRSRVALRIGTRSVTVGELEDRLAGIPPFQLATFGASRDDVVRAYLEQVTERELLLAAGAESRGLDKKQPTVQQLARARSNATLRALRATLPAPSAIPDEDVRRYYDENIGHFDSPERINLWRILCKTREEADTVLAEAKREPTVVKFNALAREHSLDKATNLRGGNVGFVAPDGTSNEAGLKVDPALVKAARSVKDGEFVAAPVAEESNWAVVWRRGTVGASKRSLQDASAQIRTTLFRERTEGAEKKLIADLRARELSNVDPSLLGLIVLPPFDAGVPARRSPADPAPTRDSGASAVPSSAPKQ